MSVVSIQVPTSLLDAVQRVTDRIIDAVRRSKYVATAGSFDWQVVVFDAPDTQNAFALPGGKIGVFTGISRCGRGT